MKVVVAIIKPFKLSNVHDALHDIGVAGLTVVEAKGHGHQKGHAEIYRSVEYVAHYLTKLRLEIIVPDDRVDQVVETIVATARTGQAGDGKVYVYTIDQLRRIRTGETNEKAL